MNKIFIILILIILFSCESRNISDKGHNSIHSSDTIVISRENYKSKLYGFWLGQNIANWTGLITEMDKIGNIGEVKTGDFYTRFDWGKPDMPSIWGEGIPSELSPIITFVFRDTNQIWGSDDDTDIEYIYQQLMYENNTTVLSAEEIRRGWLKHIKSDEENYLWVSNQRAFDLMKIGVLPPETSDPSVNEHTEMIDSQLTTEIFGLLAPGRPDIALKLANLPIRTVARDNAQWISEFYVSMHALASVKDTSNNIEEKLMWMANRSREVLPDDSYSAKMFDYVLTKYSSGITWEQTRDSIYFRYQVNQMDGYNITSQNLYCNGCFAAGINFAASLISLFYGKGNLPETIKIGTLTGWDSDNPTATWGGLIGFMIGKEGVENAFGRKFSDKYNIHRTRIGFENSGIDNFDNMAAKGVAIIDRVVTKEMNGRIDLNSGTWHIPVLP